MQVATISSKRQLTLSKDLMDISGIEPGNKVIVEESKEGLVIKPIKKSLVDELAGSLTKYVSPSKLGVSFETIMEETKKIVVEKLTHP